MFMDSQNGPGSWGHNFIGSKYGIILMLNKWLCVRLWGCKIVWVQVRGQGIDLKATNTGPSRAKMFPQWCVWLTLFDSVYTVSQWKRLCFEQANFIERATEYRAIFSPSLHTASFPSLLAAGFWRVGSWVVRWMAVRPVEWVLWQ